MEIWLNRTLGAFAALLLFGMMVLTFVDVAMRYVFNAPIGASFEVTELALGLLIFASLPLVSLKDDHVAIDLIDLVMPKPMIRLLQRLVNLVVAICMVVLAWRLWDAAGRFAQYGDMTATAEIPIAPFYYIMAVLTVLTAIVVVVKVFWINLGHANTEHEYLG